MIEVPVYNSEGSQVDTVSVDEALLGGSVRYPLLKQAYVRYHANRRQGSAATRGRSEVEGSTRKLYKQKGTGNARRGNIRTNLMKGGGVAFGKKPRSFRQDMPHKMRRLANRNAILAKLVDGEVKLIDGFEITRPSTKRISELLKALNVNRSCLVALDDTRAPEARSARNLEDVTVLQTGHLNVFDVLNHRYLLATRESFEGYLKAIAERNQRDAHEAEPAKEA
ncbi:MAG: 50S ribosomal protein L4 [Phycisphaeraceae bacterium]|nr:50S ribosomal protein L4 [Phycisphaeraceae bacterium]